ncbi:MAG: DNA mismatch endonuclease Vsr [Lysobacteraceae bacterium]|nr:MAG: DNA mismatch endonuclease Vsr [Xanthomonadaceae bacterium]
MADTVEPEVRSRMMSRIRGRNTRPETLVRSGLWARGFRFRLHVSGLAGRPDIVLPKWRTAIFVNGCFWHAHANCPYFRVPKSRFEFWQKKLLANRRRDAAAVSRLVEEGWKVITVWECALRADAQNAILIADDLIRNADSPRWEIAQPPSDHTTCHASSPLAGKEDN